ncbi:MAG: zinc ribbon domain-containing protein [bacterium]
MPIYEFYCQDCHRIFNFFSAGVNTTKRPTCPRCQKRTLERQLSRFATVKSIGDAGGGGDAGERDAGSFDEARMERAMETFAREAEGLNEDDPRQAAQMMRRLSEMAGMNIGPGMEEALKRIEAGEDPESVESEMGDLLEGEDPFVPGAEKAGDSAAPRTAPTRSRLPARDEKLYTL